MIKTILKEIIIMILLCVAILFILSVLFYDYNPINKIVPNKIAYSVPENIKNELEEEEKVENKLVVENKVYTIQGSDLNLYKKTNTYNPSKENPFAKTSSGAPSGTGSGNNVSGNGSNTGTGSSQGNNNSTQSGGTSNPSTGLK